MADIRWGIIGCGDVTEVKSGPGFQKARGSALVAVMRRDGSKAEDFARRHGVPRWYDDADALIGDAEVDAVYIATPPSSHRDLALRVARAGKPCLVEKPMAMNHRESVEIVDAFADAGAPLWVAYYRRALPRFLLVRDLLAAGAIGRATSVHIDVREPLVEASARGQWRLDLSVAGGGLFLDLGSHCLDLIDFWFGPIEDAAGHAINTAGAYAAEDVVAAAFRAGAIAGTGVWNFNASDRRDEILVAGTRGELRTPVFTDGDVTVSADGAERAHHVRNPPHVHQPLIQSIVDDLRGGTRRCESTGVTAARTSWVMDRCLESYRHRT